MSRTIRNPILKTLANSSNSYNRRRYKYCLRRPAHKNQLVQLQKAVDEITDNGYMVDSRTKVKVNCGSGKIVTNYDDIPIAAMEELPALQESELVANFKV
jgi:hypothetical protein